jgi:hypothetical protein
MFRLAQQQVQAAQTTTHLVENWLTTLRQGREQFRKLVDENSKHMDAVVAPKPPKTKG